MKKLYVTVLMLMMGAASFAQQRDPKAKAILDEVSSRFKTYKTVAADFGYQIRNSAGKILATKKGKVNMKGNMYNIDFGGNKIISDGKTIWNYDPAAKEVTVNNVTSSDNAITPQKLFTDFYNKDFMYVMGNDTKVGTRPASTIIMQPIDKKKPFARVYVAVDKATKNIISTTVVEKSGNRYVYNVSNFKPNVSLSDAAFSFDKAKYPGVEVVDLR